VKEIIWINGKIVKTKDAKVSIFDHGFLYGDGLFETMRAYSGKVFALDRHMVRLFSAAKKLEIRMPYRKTFLKNTINRLAKSLHSRSAYVRIAVTRGEGKIGLNPKLCKRPNVILYVGSFMGYPQSYYKKGARLITSSIRGDSGQALSGIKSNNYLKNILAFTEAKHRGKDDAIILNTEGFVTEATTSNIFIIKKASLITPKLDEGVLPGITRDAVISLAPILGLKVSERRLSLSKMKNADEAFLTNSITGIRGVVEIDGKKVSKGRVGRITKLLYYLYQELVMKALFCKTLFFLLFFAICIKNILACPIEGPNMPNKGRWKTGLQTNVMFDKEMKNPQGEVKSSQYFLTASFGFTDWLCFDGKAGIGGITFDIKDSQKIQYPVNLAGGYGGRIKLYEDNKNDIKCILGLHHISVHPHSTKINDVKHEAVMDEWQVSLLAAKKIFKLTPYIAGKFSKIFLIRKVDGARKRIKPEDDWGLVVGSDLDISESARLNVEGRFFDETSFSAGFNYAF